MNKIEEISDVPSKIKIKGLFQVRGELYNPSEHEQPLIQSEKLRLLYGLLILKAIILAFVVFR